jgi:uncharacterized protein (TIGR03067 family)
MERRFILLFAFLLSVSLPGNAGAQNKVALEGKWRAVEATSNGEPPPAGLLEKLTVVFVGETVSVMGASPTRFTIDTSFRPAHIDILNSRRQVGIYELREMRSSCVSEQTAIGPKPSGRRNTRITLICC